MEVKFLTQIILIEKKIEILFKIFQKTCDISVYSYNSNKLPEISSTFIYSSGWLESVILYITWGYMHQKNFNGVSDSSQINEY